ncbi:MAG: hypothetical protein RSA66_10365 [Muribaculaceae bacterium]
MIKEIKYNGHTAVPSDYENADGDLTTAIGVIPEDGTLKPLLPPSEVLELSTGDVVKYIHETSNFKHYIILKNNGNLNWLTNTSQTQTLLRIFTLEIFQVTAIGNTLIVLAADGMHYFLWKGDTDGYLYLGTEIPECSISFGLQGEMVRTDEFEISFNSISEGNIWNEFSDENKTKVTQQVLAKVNKFIADNSTSKGKFIYPFLLRYAYRLYDGTLTKHSAPILMIASSDLAPQAFWSHITGKGSYTNAKLQIVAMLQTLDYAVVSSYQLTNLLKWKDIVNSVDIFVSKPIYTYNQNGECTKFTNVDKSDCYCVCKHTNQAVSTTTYPLRYQEHDFHKLFAFTFNPTTLTYPSGRLMLPPRSVDDVKNDIKDCAQFYKLESIKVEQLKTERTIISIEEDYLQSIVTREVMTDDYDSHDRIIPQYSFSYNNRLNIANIKKELFCGHDVSSLFIFSNGYVINWSDAPPTILDKTQVVSVYVFIKQDGRDIIVEGNAGELGINAPILFFYYPNTNAFKAIIVRSTNGLGDYYEVPLEKHAFLNGAFYFGGWDDLSVRTSSYPTASHNVMIDIDNKIYTSEVNNPFVFPLLGINTVGTGKIHGICAAAKALSEGQFGQFPLYAFTSEGVWALEVSNTGSYSAKQPITRDVCINTNSITQIDSAVLFATNRGIMLISGSQTQCITDTINAQDIFSVADLPKSNSVISIFNSKAHNYEQLDIKDITLLSFLDYLSACRMIYDYTHQRIIVYNPNMRYAYVYSLKTRAWGMMLSSISDNVNAYPEALAMSNRQKADGTIVPILVDFTVSSADSATALLITRPLKCDDPNMFKTFDTVIQRGFFKNENIRQILYGSNDLYNWHIVWSSTDKYMRGFSGTPYKAFRLAVVCRLSKSDNIFGCTVKFNPRRLNQPR